MSGLAQGRTNPARDAARKEKRQRLVVRGTVPHEVQITVDYDADAGAWRAVATEGFPAGAVVGFGRTPTSAVIAVELEIFKRAR